MSSTLTPARSLPRSYATGLAARLADYYDLGKPRIVYLLLITTAAAMLMAAHGIPPLALTVWTLAGGALAAMSAGTLNCVYDAGIDRVMRRTAARPIPAGRISVFAATTHACVLGVLSFAIFYFRVNPLAAWLSLAGNAFYVVVYTMWLKRRTPLNIVIGGAAGAVPPLVGWAAVTHGLAAPAFGLFALIFLWTPPHFWALALISETDYAKAGVPMLPNVKGHARTKREILFYSVLLAIVSLALYALHVAGAVYACGASVLGTVLIFFAWRTLTTDGPLWPRRLFKYSLLYLALMCAVLVIDSILA